MKSSIYQVPEYLNSLWLSHSNDFKGYWLKSHGTISGVEFIIDVCLVIDALDY